MMVHPAGADLRGDEHASPSSSSTSTYHGQAAHAAAAPHEGRNALDAAVLGYMNVAALRQHIRPDERIHGIFTEAGDKPNIVPAHGRGAVVRALAHARARSSALKDAGAGLPGGRAPTPPAARWSYDVARPGLRRHARQRAAASTSTPPTARRSGRPLVDAAERRRGVVGSTDMGNVSYVVPAIHPMIAGVAARRLHPHRRSSPRYAGARRRRPRRARRGQGDGHDRGRPVAAARRARPRSGRPSRSTTAARPHAGHASRPAVPGPLADQVLRSPP